MIMFIGLGSSPDDMTAKARKAIDAAGVVAVKTKKTAALAAVKKASVTMDDLFETSESFDDLNSAVADRLQSLESSYETVAYCSDGSGLTDGAFKELKSRGANVETIVGVSMGSGEFADAVLKMTATRALELRPYIDGGASVEITEIGDSLLAGELKLYLLEFYDADKKAVFFHGGQRKEITLGDLDRAGEYDIYSGVFLEGDASLGKARASFGDLLRIMERLTAPDGCPWDKAQTHESIRTNMIEEAYEAVDAIDCKDIDAMTEELGDVLLQTVFHCDMAKRGGEFTVGDVISELCGKLYFRHTHIFGNDKATGSEEALKYWENAKAAEKQYTSLYDILQRLPKGFPSLLRAQKALKKAVKAGVESVGEKITEQELADGLFNLVSKALASGLDAETALNKKINEFIEEFKE